MSRHTLFVVPGTWEIPSGAGPDTPCGLLAPYAHELDRNIFDVRFVNYPAKFGPIGAGGTFAGLTGDPSYLVSRDQGVEELKRLINETPGSFGIAGFSQGGAVVDLVVRALVEGDLQHRQKDCIWAHVFASPHRAKGRSFHLDDPQRLQFEGCSGDPVTNTGSIDYFAYAMADDIFTNVDIDNTYAREIYDKATRLSATNLIELFGSMANLMTLLGLLQESGSSGDFGKLIATINAAKAFGDSNAHGRYNDPGRSYFGGKTALGHSINHLNYWGARV